MKLGLTSAQREKRKVGGTAARILMSGDEERVYHLWQELRGEREPDDLSDVLPVQLGQWNEEFNRLWFKRRTGRQVTDAGASVDHPQHDFITSTLDGKTYIEAGDRAIFEAKLLNPFNYERERAIASYQPQLQHYMMVTGLKWSVLSVLIGTLKWECSEVEADPFYQAELLEREKAFWDCVITGKPPVTPPAVEAPTPPTQFIETDMTGNNLWASLADDWRNSTDAAKTNARAEKELKALLAPNIGLAFGHGVQIKRDAAGRLRLSHWKE